MIEEVLDSAGRAGERSEGHGLMRALFVVVLVLVIAVVFDLGLLAYAMLAPSSRWW